MGMQGTGMGGKKNPTTGIRDGGGFVVARMGSKLRATPSST